MLFILKSVCCCTCAHVGRYQHTLPDSDAEEQWTVLFLKFHKNKSLLESWIRFGQNLQNTAFSHAAILLALFLPTLTNEMVLFCLQSSAAPQASCCADGWRDPCGLQVSQAVCTDVADPAGDSSQATCCSPAVPSTTGLLLLAGAGGCQRSIWSLAPWLEVLTRTVRQE